MVTSTLPLNAVPHPEVYKEEQIDSNGAPIVLSLWLATVVFLPGTMVHPVFHAESSTGWPPKGSQLPGAQPGARQEPAQPRVADLGRAGPQRV